MSTQKQPCFLSSLKDMPIELERGEGRKRERGRETSIGCLLPTPQPQAPQPGTEPHILTGNQTW